MLVRGVFFGSALRTLLDGGYGFDDISLIFAPESGSRAPPESEVFRFLFSTPAKSALDAAISYAAKRGSVKQPVRIARFNPEISCDACAAFARMQVAPAR
jgi:hypothetical protein